VVWPLAQLPQKDEPETEGYTAPSISRRPPSQNGEIGGQVGDSNLSPGLAAWSLTVLPAVRGRLVPPHCSNQDAARLDPLLITLRGRDAALYNTL